MPALKIAPNPARATLASVIAEVSDLEQQLKTSDDNIAALDELRWPASSKVGGIEDAIAEREAYLANPIGRSPPERTGAQLRDDLAAARDARDDLAARLTVARNERAAIDNSLALARPRRDAAIKAVLASDPAVRRLQQRFADAYRAFEDLRLVLRFLSASHDVRDPHFFGSDLIINKAPAVPGDQPWRQAIEALKLDADAALPEA